MEYARIQYTCPYTDMCTEYGQSRYLSNKENQ